MKQNKKNIKTILTIFIYLSLSSLFFYLSLYPEKQFYNWIDNATIYLFFDLGFFFLAYPIILLLINFDNKHYQQYSVTEEKPRSSITIHDKTYYFDELEQENKRIDFNQLNK